MTPISNFFIDAFCSLNLMGEEIYSYNRNLTTIPSEIIDRRSITGLDLSDNSISSIPDGFTNLRNLIGLNLGENALSFNPDSLTNIRNLISLNLTRNSLTVLPKIGDYTSIKVLNLSGDFEKVATDNSFKSIPDHIGNYTNLIRLYLQSTGIKFISSKIGNLINLRILDLSHNDLQALPPTFSKLTALKMLNLTDNQLTSIPSNFFKINFNIISVIKNPLNYLSLQDFKLLNHKSQLDGRLNIVLLSDDHYHFLPISRGHLLPTTNRDSIYLPKNNPKRPTILNFPSLREIAARALTIQPPEGLVKKD